MPEVLKEGSTAFSVMVELEVKAERIWGILDNFFDYPDSWLRHIKKNFAPGTRLDDFKKGGKFYPSEDDLGPRPSVIMTTTPGCSLTLTVDETDDGSETKDYILNLDTIKKGVQVMADTCKPHFHDWMNENDDVCTASVFIQCCLFGEVVFG